MTQLAGFSGWAVDQVGYGWFFIGTALLGLPVLVLVWLAGRVTKPPPSAPPGAATAAAVM